MEAEIDWKLPKVQLREEGDCTDEEGFLSLRRKRLTYETEDGLQSKSFRYDVVARDPLDAVAVVLVHDMETEPRICLRACLRPPLAFRGVGQAFRETEHPSTNEMSSQAFLWEVPAGLIEKEESSDKGRKCCAARETFEEVGIRLLPDQFEVLGKPFFLSPGTMGEKIHVLWARVPSMKAQAPSGDGSPIEAVTKIIYPTLKEILQALDKGTIADAKTEIAIRRIALKVSSGR